LTVVNPTSIMIDEALSTSIKNRFRTHGGCYAEVLA